MQGPIRLIAARSSATWTPIVSVPRGPVLRLSSSMCAIAKYWPESGDRHPPLGQSGLDCPDGALCPPAANTLTLLRHEIYERRGRKRKAYPYGERPSSLCIDPTAESRADRAAGEKGRRVEPVETAAKLRA